MKKILAVWAVLSLGGSLAQAGNLTGTGFGDGDPFPVACTDFTGTWRSDKGGSYFVGQTACEVLKIRKGKRGGLSSFTIVPDGISRNVQGSEWSGTVRHRWNSQKFGAVVETHRTMLFSAKKVTELVTLEEVNENLLLENTYRVIEERSGEKQEEQSPKYEYSQEVFRREAALPKLQKGLKLRENG